MRSQSDILSALFRILNVPSVTEALSGKVYIGEPPMTSQLEDISTNLINNPNKYLQSGYGNVNIHIPLLSDGRYNLARGKALSDIVIPLLEDASITVSSATYFFQVEDDKGWFKDNDRDGFGYYNLKLTFQT